MAEKKATNSKKAEVKKPTVQPKDPIQALDHQLKDYLAEIVTLRKIRDDQFKTIGELRNEILQLKRAMEKFNDI